MAILKDTTIMGTNKVTGSSTLATINYAADAGSTDDYAITLDPAITAYTTGQQITFKANTANADAAATLNVNSLGAKSIVKGVDSALAANDILADMFCVCIYNGTKFVLINPRTL
jgi:hypothetical protein